jgi:hypothetical protein
MVIRDLIQDGIHNWLACCVPVFVVFRSYEHSIANMFVIPLAMRLGANISVSTFIVKNLIPATIGNLIGGAIFVAMAMALGYGSLEKRINAAGARLYRSTGAPACGMVVFGAANAPVQDVSTTSCGSSDMDSANAHAVVHKLTAECKAPLKSVVPHPTAV